MSANRFSGDVRVRLTLMASMSLADPPEYRAFVRVLPSGPSHTVTVRQSAEDGMRLACDDPLAFDHAARAAFSFASTHIDEDETSPDKDVAETIGNAFARDPDGNVIVTRPATRRKAIEERSRNVSRVGETVEG